MSMWCPPTRGRWVRRTSRGRSSTVRHFCSITSGPACGLAAARPLARKRVSGGDAMRYMIPAGAILFLAFLGHSEGAGDKKGDLPPWAQVTVGGEIRDLIDVRAKVDVLALLDRDIPIANLPVQWRGPLPARKLEAKGTAH